MMRILVIGGTKFVGRAIVETALERGHDVSMLNRGQTNPDLFPSVERFTGDRETQLDVLGNGKWDAVIDTCGYVPRVVRLSAEYLKDRIKTYCFISTISVYDAPNTPFYENEDAPLGTMPDETTEEITGETYGPLKVLCENVVNELYGDNALNIRPGLINGPHDPTNRFTYWVTRLARGGDVLVPAPRNQPVQVIDARDLAAFTITLLENDTHGTFHATGPDGGVTFAHVIGEIQRQVGNEANLIYVPEKFLLEQEVGPWVELPLWMPDEGGGYRIMSLDIRRALDAGLTLRPLAETIRDTLDWAESPDYVQGNAGLAPEREKELLEAFKNAQ